jgi:hypothetical protein
MVVIEMHTPADTNTVLAEATPEEAREVTGHNLQAGTCQSVYVLMRTMD